MKKALLSIIVLCFILVLSACGTDEENAGSNNASDSKNLYKSIQDKGKILIGTEGTYPPFTFHNDEGELTGFDVEIAREVADRIGVKAVFKETKWDSMFAGLNSARFDMIANQVGKTPERKEKYEFSDPYTKSSAVLVTHKDNNEIKSFADIDGVPSAQSLTSNYADIAKEYGADVTSVEGFKEAMQLIASKRVKATINDRLSVLDYLNTQKDAPIKIVDREDDASQTAFAFREGSDKLIEAVNKALAEMKEDGTYLEISKKWFNEDVSK
ncbi:amino acid ABC transporter substrate-binding protein [Virgibacillus phasianinus]|uniref:Amino acid ABC transporter substrate-binding protein n=1 Tax=Virgibacillus phasianinus TaxID=2017483 RepID=A0A220U2V8_9BACI|nr:amino acid ABC transporter substrate-binding protein [Virgibacillus phasianinus]ASK62614.1 amino acid ABC transporter substrate-binding protein [Virgibacillus phasianinus]